MKDDEAATAAEPADEAFTARITLRLPESLKARLEAAATREGVSVNTWLVHMLHHAAEPRRPSGGSRRRDQGSARRDDPAGRLRNDVAAANRQPARRIAGV